MVSGWWDKAVPVMVGSNTVQHVTRPSAAADLLLHDWTEFMARLTRRRRRRFSKRLKVPTTTACQKHPGPRLRPPLLDHGTTLGIKCSGCTIRALWYESLLQPVQMPVS